jgi:hypothetical protein
VGQRARIRRFALAAREPLSAGSDDPLAVGCS